MSNYWKKKLEELEEEEKKKKSSGNSSNYWENKLEELEKKPVVESKPVRDIAPVETPKKEEERSWFQSGAFEDGYQFGDILRSVSATATDITQGIQTGVLKIGEGVIDAGAGLIGGVGKLFGNDEFAEDMTRFAEKDLISEEKISNFLTNIQGGWVHNLLNGNTDITSNEGIEKASFAGDKIDSLAESGGQLLGTIGLQSVGVPWYLTTGITSFGSEFESAAQQGASYEDAALSAVVSAGAELLTEKIFGGSGLGEKGLINLEPLTKGISNKVVKTLADFGVDMLAEGSEEILSGAMSAVGQKLSYADEKELNELFSSEDAWESFIGGAVLGGGANVVNVGNSIKTGRDYRTKLTTNEQKVFDQVYNDRLTEAEKDGKSLSSKEKAAIYDEVMEDLEKGAISTDTIESVLGGETYKTYQDTIKNEDALIKEYEELRKMKKGEMNDIQQDRLAELKAMNLTDTSKRDSLKSQLSEEVQKQLVRQTKSGTQADNYLIESYNERVRRSQSFQADVNQYKNENAKKTAQNALDFVQRNPDAMHNGREAHDFIDLCVKIAEDKGKVVDFTTTAEMEQSIKNGNPDNLKANPKYIEAYNSESGNKMVVNMDVDRSLPSLLGHEITDMMRGAKAYADLQKAAFSYAETKGELETRRTSIENRYKNVEADKDGELTSDLVGDYLFTDSEFVRHLSANHRNVFQKIFDEIKHLCKLATAGSKEARQLEKLKHEFEKVWRDNAKSDSKASEDVKLSFAGESAKTADMQGLAKAEAMLENDIDSETIRKETGWFQSYDKKWRYEIDDSKAVWHIDSAEPDSHRLYTFGEKVYKLGDILEHNELYEAYPQLKDVTVFVNPYAQTSGYVVGRNTDSFTLRDFENSNTTKWNIIHETQHLIQNIEGFARGSSVQEFSHKEWGEKEYAALDKRKEVARKLYNVLRRNGVSISNEAIRDEQFYRSGVSDDIIESNYWTLASLADKNKRTEALRDEYYEQVQILNATTPEGQYYLTAGEIEANDTMARLNMSEEGRKSNRPNIDNPNVVFADGTVTYRSASDNNNSSIKEQLREHLEEINKMDSVADVTYSKKNKKELKQSAIDSFKQLGFKVDRQNFGVIEIGERQINDSLNYLNNDAECAALLAVPRVLKRGLDISGHDNHKGRSHSSITFAAPVTINGITGDMAVVVKRTGKDRYYTHRILMPDGSEFIFKDTKKTELTSADMLATLGDQGTAIGPVYNDSIPQKETNVNSKYSLSDENLGYHAGDLGKAEFLFQQGRSRGTGHFGTGTYFVGNEEKISGDNSYGKRPHHAVDFTDYNLYKIKSDKDGYDLHEQLREIDGGFSKEWLDAALDDAFRISDLAHEAYELQDKYDVRHYDSDLGFDVSEDYRGAVYKAYTEIANKYDIEHKSFEEWLSGEGYDLAEMDDFDKEYSKSEYADYLRGLFNEIDRADNNSYGKFREAVHRLRWRFGYKNTENALRDVLKHQEQTSADRFNFNKRDNSFATVFMKSLGYEGIDVRGTKLDNVEYGSVIYDLKENTVKYSLSEDATKADKTYADAVNNRDWETAQKLVDDAAKKAGYTRAVYHGTESRFTVFDTDEESTIRPQHAWMADYPDGTIFLAEDYNVAGQYGNRVMEMYLDTNDIKVFEEPEMYAHRAMDDLYGYEVYNYPVIAVKGKDMTIYATLDNTLVKSSLAATYDDNGNLIPLSERFKHDNPDIRFSLSESVEETKDLVALHNVRADKLIDALRLGGLPSPSVAITKSDILHDNYGDITLMLRKDAIDPQADRRNKVYGSDAWTPTISNARTEYEVDTEKARAFEKKLTELSKKVAGGVFVRDSVVRGMGIEDTTDQDAKRLSERLANYDEVRAAYLADNGQTVEPEYKEKEYSKFGNAALQKYIGRVGAQRLASIVADSYTGNMTSIQSEEEAVRQIIRDAYIEKHAYALNKRPDLKDTRVNLYMDKTVNAFTVEDFIKDAWEFYQDGGAVTEEVDRLATSDKLRSAVNDADVRAWLEPQIAEFLGEPGIYNGEDLFFPDGRRRSFAATHYTYTAENIVKAMQNAPKRGAGTFGAHATSLIATATPSYKSIEEMHADKGRLKLEDAATYEKILADLDSALESVEHDIMRTTKHHADNTFEEEQIIGSIITEAATGARTVAAVQRVFAKEDYRISAEQAKRILQIYDEAANVPTGYFEAKPERVVGFDEVAAFIIPRNTDIKLKQELLNRGYSIAEYDPDVEGDRQKVVNSFEKYKFSLSAEGETRKQYGDFNIYAKDLRVAPMQEDIAPVGDVAPDGFAPTSEADANAMQSENIESLTDADAPPEAEAPYYEPSSATPKNPFESRDYKQVGNRTVKAYMYENPEVKPFFQAEAEAMLGDLERSTKGERWYNDELYYDSNGEQGYSGTKRHTTDDIAYLLDSGYTYEQIENALNAIINTDGEKLNACGKRIEFLLNDRLMKGYQDVDGYDIPANQEYINLLNQKQTQEAYQQSAEAEVFTDADAPAEDIAPVVQPKVEKQAEVDEDEPKIAKVLTEEPATPKKKRSILTKALTNFGDKGIVFENLAKKTHNRELEAKYNFLHYSESRAQEYIAENLKPIVDKVKQAGTTEQLYNYVYHLHNIDRMSLESEENRTKRETLREQFKGYTDKQIKEIAMEWIKRDTPQDVKDRIKAAREYVDTLKGKNKPVFDDSVTADASREIIKQLEAEHPEFKELSEAIVDYNTQLRKMLVDGNVISQETADLWAKMYPHYVPIRRVGKDGAAVNVPLDTNKTGINAPIKRATGGNSDILPLFDTMALRTEQTFKAIAKNSFGTELMHTLDSVVENEATSLDEVMENFDNHEELLQEGKNGKNPTFTVFEDGKRVTFEITEDMYDALKPTSEGLSYTNKVANTAGNIFRGLLTEYNPVFLATNAVKDVQDVLINSQHAAKTYAAIPKAIKELTTKGGWYTEYIRNGGSQNTYFDSDSKTFKQEEQGFVKTIGMPLRAISAANDFIERVPRLAEYIASRESGASIETAMLDAARVTTNFAAGGDVTKFLNRNGFSFLNASAQGAMQQVRNVREAKMNGLKGWAQLAAKVAIAGLPAILLNNLLWDDDEEYEELSDYVKQNYYVVAKYGDGQFVRIPKGRAVAVIQEAFVQMENLATGNDEVDLESFKDLVISNLAPNNPLENNILAPIMQVANNKTWYGEDLVPTRLQDLPAAEQYDESTDSFSKWLGEKLNYSPYKINYLLNQYSGGVGDMVLPMLTPESDGDGIIAPVMDKFTTDSVMKNQNVSDFYDTVDELTKKANSANATDKDILSSKYMNSVNAELSELYKKKREIQNSWHSDSWKSREVREVQKQIDEIAKEGLNSYGQVYIQGGYATVGDRHYKLNDKGVWTKLSDDQYEKQQEVTSGLGISPSTYWSDNVEYDFAYENPEKYAFLHKKDISFDDFKNANESAKEAYDWAFKNQEKIPLAEAVADDVVAYRQYTSELYDIEADKDEDGKSIRGSRKDKVIDWLNEQDDMDYGKRLILFKSEYPADDTYNEDIIEYLNSREDISYKDMVSILRELGFTVDDEGNITWD